MKQRIVAFSIVVTAAAWSLAGFGLTTDRENALKHAQQNGLNLTRAYAQNSTRLFTTIDQTLLRLRDDYRSRGNAFSLAAWSSQALDSFDPRMGLAIVDAEGHIVQSTRAGEPRAPRSDGNFAFHAAGGGDRSYIGRPTAAADGTIAITMSRPILDGSGSFRGMVAAAVRPESLSRFYRSIDTGRSGFVAIVGVDGITRARAPHAASLLAAGTIEHPGLTHLVDRPEGCHPEMSQVDGVERLVCFRRLANLPLLVTVGLSKDDILADYYTARWRYLGAAAAISLIMALMAVLLLRHEQALARTTQALRESEYHNARKSDILEITLENMSQGIFLIEADSRITVINRRARELLDLPDALVNDELTIQKVVDWQWQAGEYGENGAAVDPELRSFLQGGALVNSPPVYVRTRPNGTVLEVRTMMLPNGGAVRTLTDITRHQQTQEQLAAAKEAAESGYRSKSAFLATMSHEIRTPLNGVVGMASLLLESELTPEQRKSVETIQECSDALLELINDVLDFSKLEAGRLEIESRNFNLIELCEAVFNIIEPRARSKDVSLVLAPSAVLPAMIESDSARLRQVLLNLVGNALKFTDHGAVILQMLPADTEAAKRIRFEVIDTGIGISEEAQARLFTEFTQVEASITRRYGGTGLGLAICKKIVTAMGGEIGVHSTLAEGSTFWFEVPYAAADSAPSPLMRTVPATRTAALIAESDLPRDAVGQLLQQIGLQVALDAPPADLAKADVALIHVHHPMALDLIRGKTPPGAGKLHFLGYGFGSLTFSGKNFTMIDGALTPSSVVRALAGLGLCDAQAALPAAASRPGTSTAKRAAVSLAILLAEDNAVNQRIAATMLSNMGHTVDIAGNGRDAVAKATLRVYDVIVMDMQMPVMDGLEATRAIRALHGPEGHVPIIAMTANAFATDRDACLAAGMNDFLSKPITARKLFEAIEPWASGVAHSREQAAEVADRSEATLLADPDLIDAEQMRMIQEELGGNAVQELLVSFWADAGGLLHELELALSGEDPGRASAVLHTLKGAAASLGLIGCSHACADARGAIAEGRSPDLNALMTVMFRTLQATQPGIIEAAAAAKAA
jgi:signal transduction histidine kinase/CheY-like chemotaxis protein/HPt (histidine-containing phosphotransfer) domain-containing protein